MTILEMNFTDEGNNPPPSKKRRLSPPFVETSLKTVNNDSFRKEYLMPSASSTMINGYSSSESFSQIHAQRSDENGYGDSIIPIAPLLNLGNTCFLNSVLYTLRFAPSFLHKLHHLDSNSTAFLKQWNANKHSENSYSLSRNVSKTGLWSNKRTLADLDIKAQFVFKLHHLYTTVSMNEIKDKMEPFQPSSLLHALREVNPIFEGNQQHDAHELLVCLLDIIREVCEAIYQENNVTERSLFEYPTRSNNSILQSVKQKSLKIIKKGALRSDGDIKKYLLNGDTMDKDDGHSCTNEQCGPIHDTIFEDFRGVSLLRTTCLECEHITERKETVCDISVPIETTEDYDDEAAIDQLYKSIIVTEEYLIECNKYWCEKCLRYNEARRCVKYEKLPRLLTLHLKRFSSNFGTSVAKLNDYMPTPLGLSCFCEECLSIDPPRKRPHYYRLYAIIMHLGATIASGHYVAFVRMLDNVTEYSNCKYDRHKISSLSRGGTASSACFRSSSVSHKSPTGLSKFLPRFSSRSFNGNGANFKAWKEHDLSDRMIHTCKAADCCTIRSRGLPAMVQDTNSVWLECDDESVHVLSGQELLEMLSLYEFSLHFVSTAL